MSPHGKSILDLVLDRTSDQLIGGVLVALLLALVVTGLFQCLRHKVSDAFAIMVGLVLCSNLVAMLVGAACLWRQSLTTDHAGSGHFPSEVNRVALPEKHGFVEASHVLIAGDRDGDGLLSTEEASLVAAIFVEAGDIEGDHKLSMEEIMSALRACHQGTEGRHDRAPGSGEVEPGLVDARRNYRMNPVSLEHTYDDLGNPLR